MMETATCVHHWLIGEPHDGTAIGQCKNCGGVRAFNARPVIVFSDIWGHEGKE